MGIDALTHRDDGSEVVIPFSDDDWQQWVSAGRTRNWMLSTFYILGSASVITDNILRRQTNITRRMYWTRLPYYAPQTVGV